MAEAETLLCSWCGKGRDEIQKLIAGPDVCICDECVLLCSGIILAGLDDDRLDARLAEMRKEARRMRAELNEPPDAVT